ncbi:hypothetical protein CEXT_479651 [Caerostris extrusa]|uniref:Uncharacterized protein n=1 Tax=Caerostris extrusa TaxID=172846 RepID=A0AAV4P1Q7_CAEEX|nr:hypothetical protein CEXT_479651 [Caerostris extrusa]
MKFVTHQLNDIIIPLKSLSVISAQLLEDIHWYLLVILKCVNEWHEAGLSGSSTSSSPTHFCCRLTVTVSVTYAIPKASWQFPVRRLAFRKLGS